MEFRPSEFMARVRSSVPLVHHITNYVTVNDCANICICAGGSPVMTDGPDTAEMVGISSSTVLNIGTLNPRTVDSMAVAADAARGRIPIVLDPVGAGATTYRTETAQMLMSKHPDVIKGSDDAADATVELARKAGCVVASTGKVDYVSDGSILLELSNGSDMLGMVSGTGCMVSSVVGCYVGACGADVMSVAAAITAFNVASERAAGDSRGPGTFKPALMDALHSLGGEELDSAARWRVL